MQNKKVVQVFAAVSFLVSGSASAFAHNGVEHVMGTLKARTENSVTLETPKHATVTVAIDASTKFNKNDAEASVNDLKVGDRVVVNAKDNAEHKLVALSVRWGPKSSAKNDHVASASAAHSNANHK